MWWLNPSGLGGSEGEGRRLVQIVRRGKGGSVRVRRATMIMASASGSPVPAIARLGLGSLTNSRPLKTDDRAVGYLQVSII